MAPRTYITSSYSGNLGYGHDVDLLVAACEQLRDAGYRITMRADGRGARRLPAWLQTQPLHGDLEELKRDLFRHEVHLIAGHPRIRRAIFPSKIWNSIALGRRVICTGFAGEMVTELEAVRTANFNQHVDQWVQLILGLEPSLKSSLEFNGAVRDLREAELTSAALV